MITNEKPLTRYLSLDVLRGLTVALMIVVNSPGSWEAIYAPFKHAEWHGFTLTDLVFPTFLFVVGNAMSFSFKKIENVNFWEAFKRIGKRAFMIFLIGWLLNYFPFVNFENNGITLNNILDVRLFGVLQRIGICYFLASLLIYCCRKNNILIIISMLMLLGYWAILYAFGMHNDPYGLANNAVTLSDNWLFPAQNLYQGFGIPFEPEGLLSTIPSVVNVIVGYLIGNFIRKNGNQKSTALRLTVLAVCFLVVALAWNEVFPINKPIWTSSYVIYSLGWDILLTAILMTLIDLWQIKRWTYFFEVFGKNPLFIYILAWVILKVLHLIPIHGSTLPSLFYKNVLLAHFSDQSASLIFAITYMLLLWVIGLVLDKKKIYVKV